MSPNPAHERGGRAAGLLPAPRRPVGVFDSGVGGVSVLRHLQQRLPVESFIYFADQAHVPYGSRSAESVRALSYAITHYLLQQQCKLIVVACNTATAAALSWLRETVTDVPFVGMEPAVKPGAQATRSGVVGVLATSGTFDSQRYARLMALYAADVRVLENPCTGLVELIEAGRGDSAEAHDLLHAVLTPMLAEGVDTVVLGCTHYPFVEYVIRRIVGPDVTIIDPAPAVARQTQRVLDRLHLRNENDAPGATRAVSSADANHLARQINQLTGDSVPVSHYGGALLSP